MSNCNKIRPVVLSHIAKLTHLSMCQDSGVSYCSQQHFQSISGLLNSLESTILSAGCSTENAFPWQEVSNASPTECSTSSGNSCNRCLMPHDYAEAETTEHLLLECPVAWQVLSEAKLSSHCRSGSPYRDDKELNERNWCRTA